MTLTTTDSNIFYNGNASITAFAIPFRFVEDGDLEVFIVDGAGVPQPQTIVTDYTLTGAGSGVGGEITFVVAPDSGTDNVRIYRHVYPTQDADYVNNDSFDAEAHELAMDRLTMMLQTLFSRTGGADFDIGDTGFIGRLASDLAQWDAESMAIQNVLDPTEPQQAATMAYVDAQTILATGALLSVAGVSNAAGDVAFIAAGGGITITPDDTANTVTFTVSPGAGSIQTINTISPTGGGDFTITAGTNITIGADANGITVNASGSVSANATQLQSRDLAATAPTAGSIVVWDAAGNTWKPSGEVAVLRDQKTAGTAGGTFSSGAWQKRDLNTTLSDAGSLITSLTSSVIRLAAGTYRCRITCPASAVATHQARLRNTTDGTTAVAGSSQYSDTSNSDIIGEFTTDGTKNFEVQHRCSSSRGTFGFGRTANFGEVEVYTIAEFTRLY